MASLVRETLAKAFGMAAPRARQTIEDFTFVGIGFDPNPPDGTPVPVDHDRTFP